jgi:histone deacetylase 8
MRRGTFSSAAKNIARPLAASRRDGERFTYTAFDTTPNMLNALSDQVENSDQAGTTQPTSSRCTELDPSVSVTSGVSQCSDVPSSHDALPTANGQEGIMADRRKVRVALIHSESHTQILHKAMRYIHQDRDVLLESLLDYCGFLRDTPKFLTVFPPKRASRKHLERFHDACYLDILEFPKEEEDNGTIVTPLPSVSLLDSVGLVDDCPVPSQPEARAALWKYCCHVVGGSLQAAHLLVSGQAGVAMHWGGGRHHAHSNRAAGFCFVNDVVLAIQHLQRHLSRILYIDIDIHHADGVQDAFYDTDQVMNVSFHRHAPGFFPSTGSCREKGMHGTPGVGYNLNIPLPQACYENDFISIYQHTVGKLLDVYRPDAVVMCVGADGLKGDPIVGPMDGWNLTPEGLAECVRYTSDLCQDTKLLVLGGGGYHPARTARTFLLCTAAACEGARPGLLRNELPRDIPRHDHFPRYGPDFRLVDDTLADNSESEKRGDVYQSTFEEARKVVDLALLYLQAQSRKKIPEFGSFDDENELTLSRSGKSVFPQRTNENKPCLQGKNAPPDARNEPLLQDKNASDLPPRDATKYRSRRRRKRTK